MTGQPSTENTTALARLATTIVLGATSTADIGPLAVDNRAYNRLLRGLRWQGERGFAVLVCRWNVRRDTTTSPRRISRVAAPYPPHFEYKCLPEFC